MDAGHWSQSGQKLNDVITILRVWRSNSLRRCAADTDVSLVFYKRVCNTSKSTGRKRYGKGRADMLIALKLQQVKVQET